MSGRHPVWYAFVRAVLKYLYFGTHGGIKSVGQENIPKSGPVLVAPLHLSHLDPPAVACGMRRRMRFMAKEELFHHRLFGALIASIGAYPVRRGETDRESIRKSITLLEEGEALLVFPEGTRGDGVEIQELSRGVEMLARKTKALVVPVGVIGTNVVMPKGKRKGQKCLVILAYGKPFTYEEVATSSSERENRELFANELRNRIVALCHENGSPIKIGQKHLDSATSLDS